jgi:hypothetical protein
VSDPIEAIRKRVAAWGREDSRVLLAEIDRLRTENARLALIEAAARDVFKYTVTATAWPGQVWPNPSPLRALQAALAVPPAGDTAAGEG